MYVCVCLLSSWLLCDLLSCYLLQQRHASTSSIRMLTQHQTHTLSLSLSLRVSPAAAPATKPTLPTTGTDAYLEAAFGVDSAAGTSSAQRYGGSSNRKAGSVPFGGPPAPSPAAAPVPAAEGPPRRW